MARESIERSNLTAAEPSTLTVNSELLEQSIAHKLKQCVATTGQISFACLPAMVEESWRVIENLWQALGNNMPLEDRQVLRDKLIHLFTKGAELSCQSRVLLDYEYQAVSNNRFTVQMSVVVDPPPLYMTIALPCVPSLLGEALAVLGNILTALQNPLPSGQLEKLAESVGPLMVEKFRESADSRVMIHYRTGQLPNRGFAVNLSSEVANITESYRHWIDTREGPLFGSHPDARVMDLVATLGNPPDCPIVDVGAGNGRNSLPLARLGYEVEAIDLVPEFIDQIAQTTIAESLPIVTRQADILDPLVRLRPGYFRLAIAAELVASHFRSVQQLRRFLLKLADGLQPGGLLLFSAFLAAVGYQPDAQARELSQVRWSYLITYNELAAATANLPLELVEDQAVYDYEKAHLPPEAWPPTIWFERWTQGLNLLPNQQHPWASLRWLLYRKLA